MDIAGTSIYCDETGGDYYDYYLETSERGLGKVSMVVGDLSGHGHDPAIFYDPTTDTFDELQGNGAALGIEESWIYAENEKTGLAEGQIIIIGTDGIWETKNAQDQMFGKDPIFDIIRLHSKARAEDIMKAVISALNRFRGDLPPEDDVTLMVIKIGGTSSQPSPTHLRFAQKR